MNITEVPFRSAETTPPGVQVLPFDALLERARGHLINPSAPMRPTFHHLVAVRGGRLDCSVDFSEHRLVDGDLIWVKPGQILQFGPQLHTSQGIIVLFAPGFVDDATASAAHADRPDASLTAVRSPALFHLAEMLADEYDNPGGLPATIHIAIIRHVLSILLLRIGNHGHPSSEPANAAFEAFRQAVEDGFAVTHRVEDYARQLGYSVRTLTRTSHVATGYGAKRVIQERVLLEAKRLLAHTELTSTAIAGRIGMPDPATFGKFFRRQTGQTPTTFRDRLRGADNSD
ncbi:MAG: helix-turn-helix domain-containing protein [Mycobacterium sp.]|jgi:AraC-like DNA-binding protein|uniref:helix-turn-helix domain-containing protein n=1 Tax=Mycobacterium sp. TaxID=1785 RepID=UPI00389A8A73